MKRIVVAGLVVWGAGGAVRLHAQTAAPNTSHPAPLTSRTIAFDDAISIALKQNMTIKLAQNANDLSSASVTQAKMSFLPDLRLNVNNGLDVGRNFSQTEGRIVEQTSNSMSTGVATGVTLFDGFRNVANLNSAKANESASEQDLARTRQTVVFTVASNFLALVAQQEQLRVHQENLKAQELQQVQIETYVKVGSRPISDLYQQQAATAAAKVSVVEAQRALDLAKVDLIQTLQLDPASEYTFVAPKVDDAASANRSFDLATLVDKALTNRSDLDAQELRVEAADQGVRAAEASKWPSISLSAGYNTAYNSATDAPLADQLNERRGGSIGIGISIPLFDRGATSVAAQRAQIQEENARLELQKQRQQVSYDIRRAYLDYKASQERLKAADAQKAAADAAVEATQARYRVGAATLVELAQSRSQQVQAASGQVNARYSLVFQDALMAYYTGTLDPANVSLGN
jgi:outer membrane protein